MTTHSSTWRMLAFWQLNKDKKQLPNPELGQFIDKLRSEITFPKEYDSPKMPRTP